MCVAIKYRYKGEVQEVRLDNHSAMLPVLLRSGRIMFLKWAGNVWLDQIKNHLWQNRQTTWAKIPCIAYCQQDTNGVEHWIDCPDEHIVIGMIVIGLQHDIVYVVLKTPELLDDSGFHGIVAVRGNHKISNPKNAPLPPDAPT